MFSQFIGTIESHEPGETNLTSAHGFCFGAVMIFDTAITACRLSKTGLDTTVFFNQPCLVLF